MLGRLKHVRGKAKALIGKKKRQPVTASDARLPDDVLEEISHRMAEDSPHDLLEMLTLVRADTYLPFCLSCSNLHLIRSLALCI
jgi:hypothetical protein